MTESQSRSERLRLHQVHNEGGKWFMRTSRSVGRGPEIPHDMAKAISMMVGRSGRKTPWGRVSNLLNNVEVNCHRSAFYAMGLISLEGLLRKDALSRFQMFPDSEFRECDTLEKLEEYLKKSIHGKEVGLCQIKGHYRLIDHSFLFAPDEQGELVCFQKNGMRGLDFEIAGLHTVYEGGEWAWGNFKWLKYAAGSVKEATSSERAEFLRKYMEELLKSSTG